PNSTHWHGLPDGRSGRLLYSRRRFRRHPSCAEFALRSVRLIVAATGRRGNERPIDHDFGAIAATNPVRRGRGRLPMAVTPRRAVPIVTAAAAVIAALAPNLGAAQDVLKLQSRPDLGEVQALTRAYNASGQALFRDFSAGSGNIVFSPYSIGTAMAMALAGARGETEREMIEVLQHSLVRGQINDANARAIAILNGYDKSETPPTCLANMQLAGSRCEGKPTAK